jgi:biopolymer transport protein ExbD
MPRTSEMVQSKYLKTADVPDPVIVTVVKVGRVNMAKEDAAPEYKWAIRFKEFDKPMVLNSTNIKIAEKVFGSDDTDQWADKEIILYTDENVTFGAFAQLMDIVKQSGITNIAIVTQPYQAKNVATR